MSNLKPWRKGESGNPAGRPIGARQKISEALLSDLAEVWQEHGKDVLTKLATDEPAKLAQIAYGLLPRDIFVSVQNSGPGVNADQWSMLRGVLDAIEASGVDAEPAQIFGEIEHALRAKFAKVIE